MFIGEVFILQLCINLNLTKNFSCFRDSSVPKTCPGVPCGPPPLVGDYDDEEDLWDQDGNEKSKKIRFAGDDKLLHAEGDTRDKEDHGGDSSYKSGSI